MNEAANGQSRLQPRLLRKTPELLTSYQIHTTHTVYDCATFLVPCIVQMPTNYLSVSWMRCVWAEMASRDGSKKVGAERKRAFAPKSRLGCLTCRYEIFRAPLISIYSFLRVWEISLWNCLHRARHAWQEDEANCFWKETANQMRWAKTQLRQVITLFLYSMSKYSEHPLRDARCAPLFSEDMPNISLDV